MATPAYSHEDFAPIPVERSQLPATMSEEEKNKIMAEIELRNALRSYLEEIFIKTSTGEMKISADELFSKMNQIAQDRGCEYGIPIPSAHDVERPMILAKGTPFYRVPLNYATALAEELASRKITIRNSWSMLGDKEVCIVETEKGPMVWPRYHAGIRLRKIMDSLGLRHGTQQTAAAEMRAMESLKQRIGEHRWQMYVLSGAFAEKSTRSDIHYIFRKGLPTIAFSYHSGYGGSYDGGKVLACLCLHPMGYYQGSHVGLMCPTDEVICALLMMRGDEAKYWASCGQWSATDSRSGI
jgi:hypothetical protein